MARMVAINWIFSFLLLDCVELFPLKDCDIENKEIVFVFDCMDSVIEQIDFFQQTEKYLQRERKSPITKLTYMTFKDDGLVKLDDNVINDTELLLNTTAPWCSNDTYIYRIIPQIKNYFSQKQNTLRLSLTIIGRNHTLYETKLFNDFAFTNLLESAFTGEKVVHRNHFFIFENSSLSLHKSNLYNIKSLKDLNFDTIFPYVCEFKCTESSFTYENHAQKSFYHLDVIPDLSHDGANEFCRHKYNSYLLSIESYEEFDLLMPEMNFRMKQKYTSNTKYNVHLGLKWNLLNTHEWASRNPFVWYHNLGYNLNKTCLYITFDLVNKSVLFDKQSQLLWKYLKQVKCDEQLNNLVIICECHHIQHNKEIYAIEPPNFIRSHVPVYEFDILYLSLGRSPLMKFYDNFKREPHNHINIYSSKNVSLSSAVFNTSNIKMRHIIYCYTDEANVYEDDLCLSNVSSIKKDQTWNYGYYNNEYEEISNKTLSSITYNSKDLFDCKTEKESQHTCLITKDSDHKDNSYLQNCEHFSCPLNFFKCPNSFCVHIDLVNDGQNNCPFGEDEFLYTTHSQMCHAYIDYQYKDLCFNYIQNHPADILQLFDFEKNGKCLNYNCFSYTQSIYSVNSTYPDSKVHYTYTNLYNISNYFMPRPNDYLLYIVINIVGFSVNNCKIKRFDQSFKKWELSRLLVLDISKNDITSSNDLHNLRNMNNLVVLNISYNNQFEVDPHFLLPSKIEILDLSHTSVSIMPQNIFQTLQYLRHLNLSYTKILRFEHIGIPEYFHLDSLDVRGVPFSYTEADFFKGLTIRHSLMSSDYKMCCPQVLNVNISRDRCDAPDDVISSCRHLVGDTLKRVVIWIVGLVTVSGNGIVLIYWLRLDKMFLSKTYGLFITGLAVSDFIMGIYLIIIAATDIYFRDNFVLEDIRWRYSHFCKFAGFLATLSSETSTFFICLTTLDRFLVVTFPFGQIRITRTVKLSLFIISWSVGFIFALIPVIVPDWEIYSSNGMCLPLPLSSTRYQGWPYSMAIFVILNFLLFLLIALGQVAIFVSIRNWNRSVPSETCCDIMKSRELTVAKKLALVALSDFLCWFPIGILGMLSLNGQLFNNEVYAWVAVFVLPVNSALNPIIYTMPVILNKLQSYIGKHSQTTMTFEL